MKPAKCLGCGCTDMLIGRAKTQAGKTIYPHYCAECGGVTTQYASNSEVGQFKREVGEPARVYTRTEMKILRGEDVGRPQADLGPCVVCGSVDRVEVHHWAPYHLFGKEAEKWPIAALCQKCHSRWHRVVTPNMGAKKGRWREDAEAFRDARSTRPARGTPRP